MNNKSLVSGFLSKKNSKPASKQKSPKVSVEKKAPSRELVSFSNYLYADNLRWLKLTAIDKDTKVVNILNDLIDNAKSKKNG